MKHVDRVVTENWSVRELEYSGAYTQKIPNVDQARRQAEHSHDINHSKIFYDLLNVR